MSRPDPRRPMVGDTYTRDGWTTEVLLVRKDGAVQIRVQHTNGTTYGDMVSPSYFADTRANWTPRERS